MTGRPWLTWVGNGRPPAVSEQHAAARFWVARGLPVCRLIPRDKRPTDKAPRTTGTGPHHRLASTDLDVIDRWWRETHPYWGPRSRCNPGLPTGSWPGLLALDVDRPRPFYAWVADRPLPPTLRWSSCRPDHPERHTLVFLYPALDSPIRSLLDGSPGCVPGVDLRADGEHVVLPGAIHSTGSVYAIQRDLPPAATPPWLVEELRQRVHRGQRKARTAIRRERPSRTPLPSEVWCRAYENARRLFESAACSATVTKGQRHRRLIGLVWEGLARGLQPSDVRKALLLYVRRACPLPSDHTAAMRQIDDALTSPRACHPNEPRFTVEAQAARLLDRQRGPCADRSLSFTQPQEKVSTP